MTIIYTAILENGYAEFLNPIDARAVSDNIIESERNLEPEVIIEPTMETENEISSPDSNDDSA
jgi:hypothetical protein